MRGTPDPQDARPDARSRLAGDLEFVEDRGHRSAAQISFFAILSFIPLVLLLVGGFGLLFDAAAVRDR